MEAQQYKKNAVEIIALADGMTEVQWSRIQHLINNCLSEKKAKVTFNSLDIPCVDYAVSVFGSERICGVFNSDPRNDDASGWKMCNPIMFQRCYSLFPFSFCQKSSVSHAIAFLPVLPIGQRSY